MPKGNKGWNHWVKPTLLVFIVIGLLASLPIAWERGVTENTAKNVEIVLNYRDLQNIADTEWDPNAFIHEQLEKFKTAGVTSLAVFESNLRDLRNNRRIQTYSANEIAVLTGLDTLSNRWNETYVLFKDAEARRTYTPLIREGFRRIDIGVENWSFESHQGLKISLPYEEAVLKPLDPDPAILQLAKQYDFQIVARLADRRLPFDAEEMDRLLSNLHEHGVTRIVFDGKSVTGYADHQEDQSLVTMAQLMNKYGIGTAEIGMKQKGIDTLAYHLNYNVVRLFSLSDGDSTFSPEVIADKLDLATKDRNIRMLYLNARNSTDVDRGELKNTLNNLYEALAGSGRAIERIEANGFEIAPAVAFEEKKSSWQAFLKPLIVLGSVALIALTIAEFIPLLLLPVFVIGIVFSGLLYLKSTVLLSQALALGVAIFASTWAMIRVLRSVLRQRARLKSNRRSTGVLFAILQFVKALGISAVGIVFVVGLLNQITYLLVLEQFRGVSALHLVPIALTGIYYMFFYDGKGLGVALERIKQFMQVKISLIMVVLGGAALLLIYYYLTRTGNEGAVSPYERVFRSILENTIGVRPRFKEFMLAHPLFILGVFLSLRYRSGIYVLAVGVIGQLSIIGTFTHLHTPMNMSFLRVVLGSVLGIAIGFILIVIWLILARSWKKWRPLIARL